MPDIKKKNIKPHISDIDDAKPLNDVVHMSIRSYAKVHIGAALAERYCKEKSQRARKVSEVMTYDHEYEATVSSLVDSLFPHPSLKGKEGIKAPTGSDAPFSGIYQTACCRKEIAISTGESMIPCPGCREAAEWKLIRATQ